MVPSVRRCCAEIHLSPYRVSRQRSFRCGSHSLTAIQVKQTGVSTTFSKDRSKDFLTPKIFCIVRLSFSYVLSGGSRKKKLTVLKSKEARSQKEYTQDPFAPQTTEHLCAKQSHRPLAPISLLKGWETLAWHWGHPVQILTNSPHKKFKHSSCKSHNICGLFQPIISLSFALIFAFTHWSIIGIYF